MKKLEAWVPVKDFEWLYEVSDLGRVKRDGKILTSKTLKGRNNIYVTLYKCSKKNSRSIKSLVAEAFLEPPTDPKAKIIYINGDAMDNRLENLEWR